MEPKTPQNVTALAIKADLTDDAQIDTLFTTPLGVPDTIYCLHGIMSRGSEDNFDLGLKVNDPFRSAAVREPTYTANC